MVLALWLMYKQAPARTTLAAMGVALLGVTLVITRGHPTQLSGGGAT